jgi:hypothetical protein
MNPPRLLLSIAGCLSLAVALAHCERAGDAQSGKPGGHGSGEDRPVVQSAPQEAPPAPNSAAGGQALPEVEVDEEEP